MYSERAQILAKEVMAILSELYTPEAFSPHYQEILAAIGIEATVKLHKAFSGRRILCVKHLFDIDFVVTLALEKKDKKYAELLVYETGYSFDWIQKKMRDRRREALHGINSISKGESGK